MEQHKKMKQNDASLKNCSGNIELWNQLGELYSLLMRWRPVIIVAILLIVLLVVCFMPYPDSQGESILQHILLM